MEIVLVVLIVQGLLGAADTLWHHELTARLPSSPTAREELALHALREAIYAVVFLTLPWLRWDGALAVLLGLLFAAELVITLKDFLVEDRSRRLPPSERVLHTVMAVSLGLLLATLAPVLIQGFAQPTGFTTQSHGLLSWVATVLGLGVLAWAVRDGLAATRRIAEPVRESAAPSGRTVLITGATGFIGGPLVDRLTARGDRVLVLVRDDLAARLRWPAPVTVLRSLDDLPAETRIDAIVNLAGGPVVAGPWTQGRRKSLLASRLVTTGQVLSLIERLERCPAVLINASAVGFYGDRGVEVLADDAAAGTGFMAELCGRWEAEAVKAEALGLRVCRMRLGMVFDWSGGPLPMLAMPARFGGAAILGHGRQWAPWIHLQDVLGLIQTAIADSRYAGPINAVAPDLVTQEAMTRALARRFAMPCWLRVPAWPLKLALGEMSDLFLASQKVEPKTLAILGFNFVHPTLESALQAPLPEGEEGTRRVSGGEVRV